MSCSCAQRRNRNRNRLDIALDLRRRDDDGFDAGSSSCRLGHSDGCNFLGARRRGGAFRHGHRTARIVLLDEIGSAQDARQRDLGFHEAVHAAGARLADLIHRIDDLDARLPGVGVKRRPQIAARNVEIVRFGGGGGGRGEQRSGAAQENGTE